MGLSLLTMPETPRSPAPRRSPGPGAFGVHIALLRGINVGGKNRLSMKDLVAAFGAVGCLDVETYIQSGNVVLRARPALAARLSESLSAAILERFSMRVPVVVRTAEELAEIVRRNPFLAAGASPDTVHLAFLDALPSAERAARLDPKRSPGDAFVLRGREIYLQLPNGAGQSKLSNAYFDRILGGTSTVRNWRTVLALLEMTTRRSA